MNVLDVKKYLGIEYIQFGKSWNGCDCWGLVQLFYKNEFGLDVPSYCDVYQLLGMNNWKILAGEYSNQILNFGHKIDAENLEYGDLIILNGIESIHVGIYLDSNPLELRMLHSHAPIGTYISDIKREPYASRFLGFYRWKK